MGYRCFMIQPADESVIEVSASIEGCAKGAFEGKHLFEAEIFRGSSLEVEARWKTDDRYGSEFMGVCRYCGERRAVYANGATAGSLWLRPDTGEMLRRVADFPIGAMWLADWYKSEERKSADGRQIFGWDWDNQFEPQLCVKTPGGDWNIDGRASNCTMPDDRLHRCWIRTGTPPNITVGKGGHTCAAGAGSIQCGSYHGFLRNGELTD